MALVWFYVSYRAYDGQLQAVGNYLLLIVCETIVVNYVVLLAYNCSNQNIHNTIKHYCPPHQNVIAQMVMRDIVSVAVHPVRAFT